MIVAGSSKEDIFIALFGISFLYSIDHYLYSNSPNSFQYQRV
jgi:hypothetical protein